MRRVGHSLGILYVNGKVLAETIQESLQRKALELSWIQQDDRITHTTVISTTDQSALHFPSGICIGLALLHTGVDGKGATC